MKILSLSTALTLALVLTACGGATAPTTPTPQAPDPMTQTLNATGTITNYMPPENVALFTTVSGTTLPVGTIRPGGNVELSVTAAQASSLPPGSLKEFVDNWKSGGCDVSKLVVVDTAYHLLKQVDFTAASGNPFILAAQVYAKDAAGIGTQTFSDFFFSTGTGSLVGSATCNTGPTIDLNLTLKPGWNVVRRTYMRGADNKVFSYFLGDAVQTTTPVATWFAFKP